MWQVTTTPSLFIRCSGGDSADYRSLPFPSDVIPWQCWTRYPDECSQSRAVFVDVDFPDLIRNKREVVLNTPELVSHLSSVASEDADSHVFLRSNAYYQVGIDLRHVAALEAALASIVDVPNCFFIFVAEVSITYMETSAADTLIQWASNIGQGETQALSSSSSMPPLFRSHCRMHRLASIAKVAS